MAIVTERENPLLLTRIWCLFELNAAIDSGAELQFVASPAQRQDLSMNLKSKFQQLERLVGGIDVRNDEPTVAQDREIFLARLEAAVDGVNTKLRRELGRWLCDAAEGVVYRTDSRRPRLNGAAMALEVAEIGDRWWEWLELDRRLVVLPWRRPADG